MSIRTGGTTLQRLRDLIRSPNLANARVLEDSLRKVGSRSLVFGRINQRSSVEANSESDRGIVERIVNSFDASLTAARATLKVNREPGLTPRVAARRFFCSDPSVSDWLPQDPRIDWPCPVIQVWEEAPGERHRYRRYQPDDGLVSVMVRDRGIGIERERMPKTILDLNSDDKLQVFEAVGQFGHGGSSSLFFCESALIITKPHSSRSSECYWTLVFPELETEASKQEVIRKWFAESDDLPFVLDLDDFPELKPILPGTAIWHFGYYRGGWIKRIAGPEQSNPWGRLGRLLFSYPLPVLIEGKFARTDSDSGRRTLTGAYYRLIAAPDLLECRFLEKSENLIVEGNQFGKFTAYIFVLKDKSKVRDYLDPRHPIILTLNGQNHGEMTPTLLTQSNLPELASSMIVEIRLDDLDQEALGNIIANSREMPKNTEFTRRLIARLSQLLSNDETLQELERKRQEQKARSSNAELNNRIAAFIASIKSDALAAPGPSGGGSGPGTGGGGTGKRRPEIPQADPPQILSFLTTDTLYVSEGSTALAKFQSDARPPRYSFHGDNPRMFARLELQGEIAKRLSISGNGDINPRGYGSISVFCTEDADHPIEQNVDLGEVVLVLQSVDGRTLEARVKVGIARKPERKERKRQKSVGTSITFHAPGGDPTGEYARLIVEQTVTEFGPFLDRFVEAIEIEDKRLAAYWGEKAVREGVSLLQIEINAANPELQALLLSCKSAEERVHAKERYCRDVALDCYQHVFSLDDVPEEIAIPIIDEDNRIRAAEIFLNHDKAIRFVSLDQREQRQN